MELNSNLSSIVFWSQHKYSYISPCFWLTLSRSKRAQTTADMKVVKGVTWLKSVPLTLLVPAMNWISAFTHGTAIKRIWCKNSYEWTQETLTLSWRVTGTRFARTPGFILIARQGHSPLPPTEHWLCCPTKHTCSVQTLYRGFQRGAPTSPEPPVEQEPLLWADSSSFPLHNSLREHISSWAFSMCRTHSLKVLEVQQNRKD